MLNKSSIVSLLALLTVIFKMILKPSKYQINGLKNNND